MFHYTCSTEFLELWSGENRGSAPAENCRHLSSYFLYFSSPTLIPFKVSGLAQGLAHSELEHGRWAVLEVCFVQAAR
jgi:hypothetical protein